MARWFWSFWSVVAVLAIIVMEILFCLFLSVYQVPKIKKLDYDGIFNVKEFSNGLMTWCLEFSYRVAYIFDQWIFGIVIALLSIWLLFERFLKSEYKASMRLSLLGTVAALGFVLTAFFSSSLVFPFLFTSPMLIRQTKQYAQQQIYQIDCVLFSLKLQFDKPDWKHISTGVGLLEESLQALSETPPIRSTFISSNSQYTRAMVEEAMAALPLMRNGLPALKEAAALQDQARWKEVFTEYLKISSPVRAVAEVPTMKIEINVNGEDKKKEK